MAKLCSQMSGRPMARASESNGGVTMRVARIYTGEDGESHFGQLELSYTEMVDRVVPVMGAAKGVEFRRSPAGSFFDWHQAPTRMYMVTLVGRVEFGVSGGETRIFEVGDVLLAEDVSGNGHTTRAIGEWVRIAVALPPTT